MPRSEARRREPGIPGARKNRRLRTATLARATSVAPFDRIIVTAAAEIIPDELVAQLADGGVMILPLGPHGGPQQLLKLTKGEQGIKQEGLIGVRFVPLLPGKAREL